MGRADAAEAAVRQAEAEGLTLQPSDNQSGYRGVRKNVTSRTMPFYATASSAGKGVHLGVFATAEEAALVYARTPEAQAQVANAKPAPLTAEEAVAEAAAEGLKLERSSNAAGYRGVNLQGRTYAAMLWRAGKGEYLGSFAVAEEAALAVARSPEGQVLQAAAHLAAAAVEQEHKIAVSEEEGAVDRPKKKAKR